MKNFINKSLNQILKIIEENKGDGIDIYTILGRLQISTIDMDSILIELNKLIELGMIVEYKKNNYISTKFSNKLIGKVRLNKKGFAIVGCNDINKTQVFIAPKHASRLLEEDIVEVELVKNESEDKRAEGVVNRIIKRGKTKYIGKVSYQEENSYCFVECNSNKIKNDIYIPIRENKYIKNGDIVLCNIVRWLEEDKNPTGEILEVIGKEGEKGVDILSIAKEYGLDINFPNNVNKEVKKIVGNINDEDISSRIDLRDELIFTIDGDDAKDLDDAISVCLMPNNNFKLGVHIADVSHYVVENMKIDREALKRGTSIYLINKVIPMLPREISNGVCSLNPYEDRLTLTIDMEIDNLGNIISYEIFESVINSKARMTYNEVSNILEYNDVELEHKYEKFIESLRCSEKLAKILNQKRKNRGTIDLDIEKSKILLNEIEKPIEVKKEEIRIANRIIEEFMIIANETIAKHFYEIGIPFIYRNHDTPSQNELKKLEDILKKYGYDEFNFEEDVTPKDFQDILTRVNGTEIEYYINRIILRILKEAKYEDISKGHFGLASTNYCHFTSPIRRYPDLQIHRIIKMYINEELTESKIKKYENKTQEIAELSSKLERYAQNIEEEVVSLKKIEFLADKIGEIYEGKISNIINKGMFVKLSNTIEGLVKIESVLNNGYYYDYNENCIRNSSGSKSNVYNIGDNVKVKVVRCDLINKEIDFELEV